MITGKEPAWIQAVKYQRFTMKHIAGLSLMFELSLQQHQPQRINMLVNVAMDDGTKLKGHIEVPAEGGLPVVLNGLNQFLELRTYEGDMHYISKDSMRSVRPVDMPEKERLPNKLRRFLRSDPYEVLGVDKNADKKTISDAYKRQLKNFHEVLDYLDTTYKCLNTAYKQIETSSPQQPQISSE